MRVILALKVRNEADIIEANLRYHLAMGVDGFVITDNESTDGTREILATYEESGLAVIYDERAEDFWSQAHAWVTRMARTAGEELEADWVLHADADEFWAPAAPTIKAALASVPERYDVVLAPRPEFIPQPDGPGAFHERMTVRERYSRLRPKVAHRAIAGVSLHQGAHDVDVQGRSERPIVRSQPRNVRYSGRDTFAGQGALVWAPCWPARVMHFPVRSFEQYTRRVETLLFRGDPPRTKARRQLMRRYTHGRLDKSYARLMLAEHQLERRIADGRLVVDERIRDALAEPSGNGTPGWSEAEDLAEIEFDAMQSLARSQRTLIRRLDRAQKGGPGRKARVENGGLRRRLARRVRSR